MRKLFFRTYGILLAGLFVALLLSEYASGTYYERGVEADYIGLTEMLVKAMHKDIAQSGNEEESLEWWHERLSDDEVIDFSLIPLPAGLTDSQVTKKKITELEDTLEILIPFDQTRAIKFLIQDRADTESVLTYYAGHLLIFLVLAMLTYGIIRSVFHNIESIRSHAHHVASGNYDVNLTMPNSTAFAGLEADLNQMTKSLREQKRENHLLTAAIHHELRTPITRIRLALDMAIITSNVECIPDLLKDMDIALTELSTLMEDLLTLSRLRLTHERPPTESVQLDRVLANLVDASPDQRIRYVSTPCELRANKALLERALSNLIDNAKKYSREQIRILLSVIDDSIILEICDDGPGIPDEAIESLRQPFFRVSSDRNRATGGTGLGLAIADLALKESAACWEIGRSDLGGASIRLTWNNCNAFASN